MDGSRSEVCGAQYHMYAHVCHGACMWLRDGLNEEGQGDGVAGMDAKCVCLCEEKSHAITVPAPSFLVMGGGWGGLDGRASAKCG